MGEPRARCAGLSVTPHDRGPGEPAEPTRDQPTLRPPDGTDDGQAAWSRLHHGIDPDAVPFVAGYVRVVQTLARPFLRVPPTAITALGVVVALTAVPVARSMPALALALVLGSVLCDALDGAVAALADAATDFGYVADKVADRIADIAFAIVLWRCGAPWWLAACAGGLSLGHEGYRALRGGALLSTVTVDERPTRTICTALGCLGAAAGPALVSSRWPVTLSAAVWVALAVVGAAQLLRVDARRT